jgi:hypothetical protein
MVRTQLSLINLCSLMTVERSYHGPVRSGVSNGYGVSSTGTSVVPQIAVDLSRCRSRQAWATSSHSPGVVPGVGIQVFFVNG